MFLFPLKQTNSMISAVLIQYTETEVRLEAVLMKTTLRDTKKQPMWTAQQTVLKKQHKAAAHGHSVQDRQVRVQVYLKKNFRQQAK